MTMQLEAGTWVLTADGTPLGRIKRVDDAAFLLDVPGEPDYWLRRADVSSVGEEVVLAVRMSFDESDLDDHRIKYGE